MKDPSPFTANLGFNGGDAWDEKYSAMIQIKFIG